MKMGYTATNQRTGERIDFFAHSTKTANRLGTLDAHNWIVNHLDMSDKWDYNFNGKFKHAENETDNKNTVSKG